VPLKIGPEIEIPRDLALIVHTGIPGSQSNPESLARVYRDSAGHLRTDTLVTIQSLGLPTGSQGAYFTGFAADDDGSAIIVQACTSGSCFIGGGGQISADAKSAIYESIDGGVTWSQLLNLNGVAFLIDVLADGRLIARLTTPGEPVFICHRARRRSSNPSGRQCGRRQCRRFAHRGRRLAPVG
jgi:hypothetical protein